MVQPMRITFTLLSISGLAATAIAQAPGVNEFGLYPTATSFTSRSGIAGASAGDVLTRISSTNCVGVGQVQIAGTPPQVVGRANGFRLVIQDQDASTIENYSHVILPPDAGGQPDANPANELVRSGSIAMPPGPVGPAAFLITNTFTTPFDGIPQTSNWFFGTGVEPNALWTADGLSVHAASYALQTTGDDPRLTGPQPAPNVTHIISRPASGQPGMVGAQPSARTHRHHIMTEGAILNGGQEVLATPTRPTRGPQPSFGVGGFMPVTDDTTTGRSDGLHLRLRDIDAATGSALYVASIGFGPGIRSPVFQGLLYLNTAVLITAGQAAIPASGEHIQLLALPSTLPRPLTANIAFQAVTIRIVIRLSYAIIITIEISF
jgi:hypothetical protein